MTILTKYRISRGILLFWCIFIGVGAICGSILFWLNPHGDSWGMSDMLPYFQVLPFADFFFQDFIWCGIALLCVNGITNVTASILILRHRRLGLTLGTVFGVTLILWILLQLYIFPLNALDIIYLVFGILQTITGLSALHYDSSLQALQDV